MRLAIFCVFTGASGLVAFDSVGSRNRGVRYVLANFQPDAYNADSDNAFIVAGDFADTSAYTPYQFYGPYPNTGDLYFNGPNGAGVDNFRYEQNNISEVIKVAVFVNLFNEDETVNLDMVQYLSAVVMAVREINDKADGIADDVLPRSFVVLSVHQPEGLNGVEEQVLSSTSTVFGGTGRVTVISCLQFRLLLLLLTNAPTSYWFVVVVVSCPYRCCGGSELAR